MNRIGQSRPDKLRETSHHVGVSAHWPFEVVARALALGCTCTTSARARRIRKRKLELEGEVRTKSERQIRTVRIDHRSLLDRRIFVLAEMAVEKVARRIAQRFVPQAAIPTPRGPRLVTLGVYLLDGAFAGYFARLTPTSHCSHDALVLPVFVQGDDDT